MSKKIFTDESLRTFVDEVKAYTDASVVNHHHDSKYDAKGSANSALESAQSYTDTLMAGFEEGFEEVIGQMYGEDLTDINAPTIREIANDEANKVQTNLDSHASNTSLHFTTSEKTKLSGIETGAQKNTITGVKGNSESSYRTGNVNITKANIGLGNVDNTSDANKPVSTAQQEAMDTLFAQAKKYADDKDALLLNNSSTAVDSIMELATVMAENEDVVDALEQAIGTKANASDLTSHTSNKSNPHGVTKSQVGLGNVENKSSATIRSEITKSNVTTALGYTPYTQTEVDSLLDVKVDKVSGKGLSTNDYTTAEKTKLSGIAEGAEVNQNAFGKVTVGSSTITADAEIDTLTMVAGTGISLTADTSADKVTITNSGVRSVSTGSTNGTISVNTDGESVEVAVKGLGSAAYTESSAYAEKSHGTHVTWSTTSPKMNGTATVGTETKVARGDHIHPTDTSRASQTDLDALEAVVDGKAPKTHSHAISDVTNLQTTLDGKSNYDHAHNYAGSSEAGGAATSANKLNTNAGSATQPVYFSGGIPVACTNTLGKSVPSDAVFTDGKVSQAPTSAGTTNANYRLLLSGSADDTSRTEGARKDPNLYFNPSTGVFTVPIVKLGDATISYDTTEKAIVFNFE